MNAEDKELRTRAKKKGACRVYLNPDLSLEALLELLESDRNSLMSLQE